jgi:hypothetical protein
MNTNQQLSTCIGMVAVSLLWPLAAVAQHPPSIGYMFPPGGQAGQTIEVTLGGYDWTPDMQVFVRDERIGGDRIELEIVGSPGPIIVPEPPYWFGKKARRPPFPLPRETKARLTIPENATPGVVRWQAASANGSTASGRFAVTDVPIQLDSSEDVNLIQSLPVCVFGQIKHISEVDRFQFVATEDGRITCSLAAASIASPLRAILEVRDGTGKVVADAADTAGADIKLSFDARANETYGVALYDLDFRGNRSFVYQLTVAPEDAVLAGSNLSDPGDERRLTVPAVLTSTLVTKFGEERFRVTGKAGEVWTIAASGEKTGSQVDPAVTVLDGDGKQLARADDTTGSTDAVLEFKVPADGDYEFVVSDISGSSGSPTATYELSIQHSAADFQISTAEKIDVLIGGKATLQLNVVRQGGFTDPIDVALVGLPDGVTVAEDLQVPAKQTSLKVELQVAEDAAAIAKMVSVEGHAVVGEQSMRRAAEPVLVCTTIKPPFSIDAEGQDDVTKWPRGTTFPAPVLISRDPGFTGEILLEMTSKQGRHRQGISGPDMPVGPNVTRVLYPVFLPEWLETTRTSRMVVNGVAQVADPKGNVRYSVSKQKTRMGFLPIGAMLKISADQTEFEVGPDARLVIPVTISRDESLDQPLTLSLVSGASQSLPFSAASQIYANDVTRCDFVIDMNPSSITESEYTLTIRASLLQDGQYPVISETTVIVVPQR